MTPVVKTTGARFGFNMISAVNAKGQCRFMIIERRMTAVVFCEFLRRLLQGMTRKIVLIVDGHPTHKAKRCSGLSPRRLAGWSCACCHPIHPI
jgi:transposase-like protein